MFSQNSPEPEIGAETGPGHVPASFGAQFSTNEPWTDADERGMGIDDDEWIPLLRWEGPFAFTTDPSDPAYYAKANETGAIHPKLRTYHQTLDDYRRKRAKCEAEFLEFLVEAPNDEDSLCYPLVGVPKGGGAFQPGCPLPDQFFGLRYGRFCGSGYPEGHPFNDETTEPIDGVDYCCRLHDWGIWSWEYEDDHPNRTVEIEDLKACGMVMCLSQASAFPPGIVDRMPDVEEARQCWFDFASDACEGNQPELPPPPLPD